MYLPRCSCVVITSQDSYNSPIYVHTILYMRFNGDMFPNEDYKHDCQIFDSFVDIVKYIKKQSKYYGVYLGFHKIGEAKEYFVTFISRESGKPYKYGVQIWDD